MTFVAPWRVRRPPVNWFRVYHDIIDDPKFMTLPLEVLGFWTAALCVASRRPARGTLPGVEELAFRTRQPADKVRAFVDLMLARNLLTRDKSGNLSVYKWADYQPSWDDASARQKARRARLKSQRKNADSADVSRDSHVTGDVTVTDQRRLEEKREEEYASHSSGSKLSSPLQPQPPLPPGAAAAAPDRGGERLRLEHVAREALGPGRFDLECAGQAVGAWLAAYPPEWVEPAVLEAAASAPPNKFAAYAHKILLRAKAAGGFVPLERRGAPAPGGNGAAPAGADLSPSQRRNQDLVNGFKRRAEDARRKARGPEREAADGPG